MTERRTFLRKIGYAGAIVALLVPLSFLTQPETRETPGGWLAQMRAKHDLSQAKLGEVDPASETMKLATLGLRPLAVVLLWESAHEYKRTEDFGKLAATLEQITKLQPNFVKVWDFQAHNITYNVSAEFDDYHDRYAWVRKGLMFLISGTEYNRDNPLLLSRVGFFVYHKIGKSDEKIQYRRLFKEDDELHDYMNVRSNGWMNSLVAYNPQQDRDSWLTAWKWYRLGENVVDTKGKPPQGTAPVIFFSDPVMMLINYAVTLEQEGHFGDEARNAWKRAAAEFDRFASRDIRGSAEFQFRLADMELMQKRATDLRTSLERILPGGTYQQMLEEKKAKLPEEARLALDTPADKRTEGQRNLAEVSLREILPSPEELIIRVDPVHREEARRLMDEAAAADKMANAIEGYRGIVNYDFWRARCLLEPTDEALEARESIYLASRELDKGNLLAAKLLYERAWTNWRQVLNKSPRLREDDITSEDMLEEINKYYRVLQALDQDRQFPKGFVLEDLVERFDKTGRWRKPVTATPN